MGRASSNKRKGPARTVRNPHVVSADVREIEFDVLAPGENRRRYVASYYSNVLEAFVWVAGAMRIIVCAMLEMEPGVESYSLTPRIQIPCSVNGTEFNVSPDAEVKVYGATHWLTIEAQPSDSEHWRVRMRAINDEARLKGITHRVITADDVKNLSIFYENSMFLRCKITSVPAERFDLFTEEDAFEKMFGGRPRATLDELLQLPGVNPAKMMTVIACKIRSGAAHTNLNEEMFTLLSTIECVEGLHPGIIFAK